MIIVQCTDNAISSCNRVATGDKSKNGKHIFIVYGDKKYPVTLAYHSSLSLNELGLSEVTRKWLYFAIKANVEVLPIDNKSANINVIGQVHVDMTYLRKQYNVDDFDTMAMSQQFSEAFSDSLMSRGQFIPFIHTKEGGKKFVFQLAVTKLYSLDMSKMIVSGEEMEWGMCSKHTSVVFTTKEDTNIILSGHTKTIFNPEFDFSKMGIGGLDEQFSTMFRRVFASRVLPLEIVEKMGIKHVKGILMYGPPGTGKTLMARQIGKMLNSREPKIVNGPEVLNKYVGESEGNIRKLFEDAEKEEKERGKNSQLHIIIFDEIDSICKSRGSTSGGTGVGDSIVNQLLSKIDGINSLNNVLIIGMTNRPEMLDEALTRQGRLELKIEIGLPTEAGRKQIFGIHLSKLIENEMLHPMVDINQLASVTKNFTGAEIEGLVRAAASYSYNRCIDSTTYKADEDKINNIQVTPDDFKMALTEIQPAFGTSDGDMSQYLSNTVVSWEEYAKFIEEVNQKVDKFKTKTDKLFSMLLSGIPKDGKTTMAVNIANYAKFPFMKMITPENMIGMSEARKIEYINGIFQNAYKSNYSAIVIDDIDIIIEYNEDGHRYSNSVVQALNSLIKKVPKNGSLLIVGTTTKAQHMIEAVFMDVVRVPRIYNGDEVKELGYECTFNMDFSERPYGIKEILHMVNYDK